MTKDVLVSIRGLQFAGSGVQETVTDEELDRIETICPGEYYFRNGTHFILYEEIMEEFGEPVKNIIKFRDKEFTYTKKGPVNVQLVLAEGKKTMTDYRLPYGSILIAFDTREVGMEEDGDHIKIHIKYGLEANYQFLSDCNITVDISARKNGQGS